MSNDLELNRTTMLEFGTDHGGETLVTYLSESIDWIVEFELELPEKQDRWLHVTGRFLGYSFKDGEGQRRFFFDGHPPVEFHASRRITMRRIFR